MSERKFLKRKILTSLWLPLLFAISMPNILAARAATATAYPIPTPGAFAIDIAAAGGTNNYKVWFTEQYGNKLGLFNNATSQIVEYSVPTVGSWPNYLEVDPAGIVWFTEATGNKLAKFDRTSSIFTEYALPLGSYPGGVVIDSGMIWFTVWTGDYIVKFDPSGSTFTYYSFPSLTPGRGFNRITIDGAGNPWFTESEVNMIAKLDVSGLTLTEYSVPTVYTAGPHGKTWPYDIAHHGMQGRIWFSEWDSGKIATFYPNNSSITEYTIPTSGAFGAGIDIGNSTTVWFVQGSTNKIGVLNLAFNPPGVNTPVTGAPTSATLLGPYSVSGVPTTVTGVTTTVTGVTIAPTVTGPSGIKEYDLSAWGSGFLYNIDVRPYTGGQRIAWVVDTTGDRIVSFLP